AYAAAEAVGYFRAAVGLLERTGDDSRRAMALVGLGEAATLAADHPKAERSYAAARESALRAGDTAGAARAGRLLGRERWRQGAPAEARLAFAEALVLLGPGDSAEAA